MHFVGEVAAGVSGEMGRLLRVNDAVKHKRIQRKEAAAFHDFVISVGIAVGNPALAVGPDSGKVGVVATAPDRVGIEEPERRRVGSGGEIDEKVGLQPAKVTDEMKRSVEVAAEGASLDDLIDISGAVKLELIDAIPRHHLGGCFMKARIIFWTG